MGATTDIDLFAAACGQTHLFADIIEIDEQGPVLPAVRHRNMTKSALDLALVGMMLMQISLSAP